MKNKKTDTNKKVIDGRLAKELAGLLRQQTQGGDLSERYDKQKLLLSFLGHGVNLAVSLFVPGQKRLYRDFVWNIFNEEENEWKVFNINYLKRAIRKLENQKIIEVDEKGKFGIVKLTDKGRQKILKFCIEEITIKKPSVWDGKWRMVFYDVIDGKKRTRDQLRRYLVNAGFYPLQESVYLHAYPCDDVIEFLRNYLFIRAEVRLATVDKIENDHLFREYFNV